MQLGSEVHPNKVWKYPVSFECQFLTQCCYSSEKGKWGLVKRITDKAVTHRDTVSPLQVILFVAEEYCKWFTEPKAFPLSASSSTLLIGSSGQASVTDRNACEHTLLIGISRSGVPLSDENCWCLPDASSLIPYKVPMRRAHQRAVALQHKWLCWHTLGDSRCWPEAVTWVSAFSLFVFVSALF